MQQSSQQHPFQQNIEQYNNNVQNSDEYEKKGINYNDYQHQQYKIVKGEYGSNKTSAMKIISPKIKNNAEKQRQSNEFLQYNFIEGENSFDQTSSSRLELFDDQKNLSNSQILFEQYEHDQTENGERLEVLESQQFDTQLELFGNQQQSSSGLKFYLQSSNLVNQVESTLKTAQTNVRIECEGTEIELDNFQEKDIQVDQSSQEIEDLYVQGQGSSTLQSQQIVNDQSIQNNINLLKNERDDLNTAIIYQSAESNDQDYIYNKSQQSSCSSPAFNKYKETEIKSIPDCFERQVQITSIIKVNSQESKDINDFQLDMSQRESKISEDEEDVSFHQNPNFLIQSDHSLQYDEQSQVFDKFNRFQDFAYDEQYIQQNFRKMKECSNDRLQSGKHLFDVSHTKRQQNPKFLKDDQKRRENKEDFQKYATIQNCGNKFVLQQQDLRKSEHKSLEQRLKFENKTSSSKMNQKDIMNQASLVSKQRVRKLPVSNTPKKLKEISTAKKNKNSEQKYVHQQQQDKNNNGISNKKNQNINIINFEIIQDLSKNVYNINKNEEEDHQAVFLSSRISAPIPPSQFVQQQYLNINPSNQMNGNQSNTMYCYNKDSPVDGQDFKNILQTYNNQFEHVKQIKNPLFLKKVINKLLEEENAKNKDYQAGEVYQYSEDIKNEVQKFANQIAALPRRKLYLRQQQILLNNTLNSKQKQTIGSSAFQNPPIQLINQKQQTQVYANNELNEQREDEQHAQKYAGRNANKNYGNLSNQKLNQNEIQNNQKQLITKQDGQKIRKSKAKGVTLQIGDINEGVIYDKNGRGKISPNYQKQTLHKNSYHNQKQQYDAEDDENEQLINYKNQIHSKTISPNKGGGTVVQCSRVYSNEAIVLNRVNKKLQKYLSNDQLQKFCGGNYFFLKVYENEEQQSSEEQRLTCKSKRIKKPKDIYSIHSHVNQKQFIQNPSFDNQNQSKQNSQWVNFTQKQERLHSPKEQEKQICRNKGQKQQRVESYRNGRIQQEYQDGKSKQNPFQHQLNSYKSIQNMPTKVNNTFLIESPSRIEHKVQVENKSANKTNQESIKQWMQSKQADKLLKTFNSTAEGGRIYNSRSLAQKSQKSFTMNRLCRKQNDQQTEIFCQDNIIVIDSPSQKQKIRNNKKYAHSQFHQQNEQQLQQEQQKKVYAFNNFMKTIDQAERASSHYDIKEGTFNAENANQMQQNRGRQRHPKGYPQRLRRIAISEAPPNKQVNVKEERKKDDEQSKKSGKNDQSAKNLSLWCCLHSKSRAASCETKGAEKANNSDYYSSGCSIF